MKKTLFALAFASISGGAIAGTALPFVGGALSAVHGIGTLTSLVPIGSIGGTGNLAGTTVGLANTLGATGFNLTGAASGNTVSSLHTIGSNNLNGNNANVGNNNSLPGLGALTGVPKL